MTEAALLLLIEKGMDWLESAMQTLNEARAQRTEPKDVEADLGARYSKLNARIQALRGPQASSES